MRNIIFIFLFLIQQPCTAGKIILLNTVQSKILSVAMEDFKKNSKWDSFNTMIIDRDVDIEIAFCHKSDLDAIRGGGMEQIIYIISKDNYRIKSIEKNLGK